MSTKEVRGKGSRGIESIKYWLAETVHTFY